MAGLWINGCNVATWLLLHSFVADGLLLTGVVDRVAHVQKKERGAGFCHSFHAIKALALPD